MVDIHSHILFDIDDGAKNEEMTLAMLRIASENGTRKIFATPHYDGLRFAASQEEILQRIGEVNDLAKKHQLDLEILPGREVMLNNHTLQAAREGKLSSLGSSNYLLAELPMFEWKESCLDIIYELQLLGYKIIIAHPERYVYVQEDVTILNKLIREEVLFQINAGSLTGNFGKIVQQTAAYLADCGAVHFIASDAHSNKTRNPNLQKGYEALAQISQELARQVKENAERVLRNEDVPSGQKFIQAEPQSLLFGIPANFIQKIMKKMGLAPKTDPIWHRG